MVVYYQCSEHCPQGKIHPPIGGVFRQPILLDIKMATPFPVLTAIIESCEIFH